MSKYAALDVNGKTHLINGKEKFSYQPEKKPLSSETRVNRGFTQRMTAFFEAS
jgi:hypothetical protein